MAGTFSRQIHAFCAKQGVPLIGAQARDRKHELAQPYLPNDPKFSGLFLVIKSNAPAPKQWAGPDRRERQLLYRRERLFRDQSAGDRVQP
jgi:hypothetical protein